jgi:hypothetical protein
MTDDHDLDLDRRLRDAMEEAALPAAPPSLQAAVDRLGFEGTRAGAAPVRARARLALAPLFVGAIGIVLVALVGGWYGGRVGGSPLPAASEPTGTAAESGAATATGSPTSTGGPAATSARPDDLVATDGGLSLTVTSEARDVAPGGRITFDLVIRNDRSVPVELAGPCGAPTMSARVPVPVEPAGRTWNGISGAFKTFALTQGLGPIDHPEATSRSVDVLPTCLEIGPAMLAPGASTRASFTWTVELIEGVPAPPGEIPVSFSVPHDPTGGPPSRPPDDTGPIGSWSRMYDVLTVAGVVQVVGDAPKIVTAGQALDAILADSRFVKWLGEKPKSTWSVANLFLINYGAAQGIVPVGPSWEIDLFREFGVPRNWAIGFVDPFTGKLSNLTFCNVPCDR